MERTPFVLKSGISDVGFEMGKWIPYRQIRNKLFYPVPLEKINKFYINKLGKIPEDELPKLNFVNSVLHTEEGEKALKNFVMAIDELIQSNGKTAYYVTPLKVLSIVGTSSETYVLTLMAIGVYSTGTVDRRRPKNYIIPAVIRSHGLNVEIITNTPTAYYVREHPYDPEEIIELYKKLDTVTARNFIMTASKAGGLDRSPLDGEFIHATSEGYVATISELSVGHNKGEVFITLREKVIEVSGDKRLSFEARPKVVSVGKLMELKYGPPAILTRKEEHSLNVPIPYTYSLSVKEDGKMRVFTMDLIRKYKSACTIASLLQNRTFRVTPRPKVVLPCDEAYKFKWRGEGIVVSDSVTTAVPNCGKYEPGHIMVVDDAGIVILPVFLFVSRDESKILSEHFYGVVTKTNGCFVNTVGKVIF